MIAVADSGPRIRLALRYDDVSNGSPSDLDAFVCGSVVRAGLAITAAVVPWGIGPEDSRAGGGLDGPFESRRAAALRADGPGRIEIAVHGFDHRPVGRDPAGRPAEFGGQPVAEQRVRLARGTDLLEEAFGHRPTTFVPPWNRYDAGTVEALETLGFEVLSAGRDPPPDTTLRLVPATAALSEIRPALEAALARPGRATIVGLLHPYDFAETGSRWAGTDREGWADLLAWLAACPDIGPWTIGDLGAADPSLGVDRGRVYAAYHASPTRRWIGRGREGSVERPLTRYPTAAETRWLARRRLGEAIVGAVAVAVLAGLPGWWLGGALPSGAAAAGGVASTLAALGVWIRARRGDGPHARGLAASVAAAAFSLGMWIGRAALV